MEGDNKYINITEENKIQENLKEKKNIRERIYNILSNPIYIGIGVFIIIIFILMVMNPPMIQFGNKIKPDSSKVLLWAIGAGISTMVIPIIYVKWIQNKIK